MIAAGGVTPPIPTMAYIRGGGDGSYIDTGITPDQTTKVIVWARNWNPGGGSYTWLFGSRVANQDSMFGLTLMSNANTGKVRACFGDTNTDLSDKWALMSHYHKYELSSDGFYVDDVLVSSITAATFSNIYNIHLLGCNNGGVRINGIVPTDIVACKIYKGGNLVRDYSPVESPSVGLYDAVSETVFTNAGTGSFSYGSFDPNAYTPLDYVSTGGSSWFDTSEIGGYDTPILVKFTPTGTTAANYDVCGGRDATNRLQIFTGNTTYRNARLYGMLGTGTVQAVYSSNTNDYLKNKEVIVVKANNAFSAYYNYAALGSTVTYSDVGSSYSTGRPIAVGASINQNDNHINPFVGKLQYARIGGANLVPAKVNNVAGMYDTYGDTFHPSTSGTDFTAGNEL